MAFGKASGGVAGNAGGAFHEKGSAFDIDQRRGVVVHAQQGHVIVQREVPRGIKIKHIPRAGKTDDPFLARAFQGKGLGDVRRRNPREGFAGVEVEDFTRSGGGDAGGKGQGSGLDIFRGCKDEGGEGVCRCLKLACRGALVVTDGLGGGNGVFKGRNKA
ncbi:MAG: hypothetical protein LBQ55_01965 [Treponema sp.]|nr:hypothetical protein [Treponema sp.]